MPRYSPAHLLAYSDDHDSAFQKGLIALRDNQTEVAVQELRIAAQEKPSDARVRSFLGIALTRLGKNAEAATEYREAIRLDPAMEDAFRNLGFLEWKQELTDQALKDLQRAVDLAPNDSFAHYYLGRVELEKRIYAKALEDLHASTVPWPDEPDFLISVASAYLSLDEQQKSRSALNQALSLPLDTAQSLQAVSLLLSLHENKSALELLRKLAAANRSQNSAWLQFDLGLGSLLAGSYADAHTQMQLYLDRQGSDSRDASLDASAWSVLGIAYAHTGETDLSIAALRRAAALQPKSEDHWLNLTRELMSLDRFEDAISATKEGIAAEPNSYALHLRLGAANLAANHYDQAEATFRELVAAGDPLPTSYVGLAQVLLRTGRIDEAVSELEGARRKLGPNFLICYFQGLALRRTATPAKAVPVLEEALRLNPGSAEAHLELGKAQLASGNAKEAVSEFEEALRLSPSNGQAQRLLIHARHRAGDARKPETVVDEQPTSKGDLLSDFILPQWQVPAERSVEQRGAR